jgi:hypothetical protein
MLMAESGSAQDSVPLKEAVEIRHYTNLTGIKTSTKKNPACFVAAHGFSYHTKSLITSSTPKQQQRIQPNSKELL